MNKYKEARRLSASTLRALCVREDWYTRGDNDEYEHLLLDLAGDKPHLNTGDIIAIAEDIAAHSALKEGWTVEAIAFEVARACTVTFQRVPVTQDERGVTARRVMDDDLTKIKAVLEATKCTEPGDVTI